MAELWPFNGLQDGGRRHLGFLTYVNTNGKSGCRTPFSAYMSNLVEIYAKMSDIMAKSVVFNMAAAAILDFVKYEFYW